MSNKTFIQRYPVVKYAVPMVVFFILMAITATVTENTALRFVGLGISAGAALLVWNNVSGWFSKN